MFGVALPVSWAIQCPASIVERIDLGAPNKMLEN